MHWMIIGMCLVIVQCTVVCVSRLKVKAIDLITRAVHCVTAIHRVTPHV